MEHSKWNEEQIQKHLENMPSFRDRRSKEAIFHKVQLRLVQGDHKRRKSIKVWGIPAFASACAVALMVILTPAAIKPFQEQDTQEKREFKTTTMPSSERSMENTTFKVDSEAGKLPAPKYHAPILATEQVQDWVTIAYMDEQAQLLVPVSFLVDGDGSYVKQLQDKLNEFQPAAAGLSPSPFEKMKITEKNDTLQFDIAPGTLSEADTNLFEQMIELTFSEGGYTDAYLFSDGKPGYDLGNMGAKESFELAVPGAPHYLYVTGTHDEFLVSTFGSGFHEKTVTLEEALNVMDEQPSDPSLRSVIPFGLTLTVEEKAELTTIRFPKGTKLADDEQNKQMLDAILLTANSYGMNSAIMFENTGVERIGPYPMEKPFEGVNGINFIQ
ncbi:hypothetical protein ACFQPF_14135 [Fictibacillus iocasae]|uniref:GerMN domain-containing protein n=1 Tax=Fictibacillus iocasae TaxID=2715437 RepID=A0ABW2NUW5_9BACL